MGVKINNSQIVNKAPIISLSNKTIMVRVLTYEVGSRSPSHLLVNTNIVRADLRAYFAALTEPLVRDVYSITFNGHPVSLFLWDCNMSAKEAQNSCLAQYAGKKGKFVLIEGRLYFSSEDVNAMADTDWLPEGTEFSEGLATPRWKGTEIGEEFWAHIPCPSVPTELKETALEALLDANQKVLLDQLVKHKEVVIKNDFTAFLNENGSVEVNNACSERYLYPSMDSFVKGCLARCENVLFGYSTALGERNDSGVVEYYPNINPDESEDGTVVYSTFVPDLVT